MDTILNIEKLNQDKYRFVLKFINNGDESVELPIDRIENSAELVGIVFKFKGKQLEPVNFRVISKKIYNNILVEPDDDTSIELFATIERKDKYHYLMFKNASYEIVPGEEYKIWFSLNGYVSNSVKLIFD